MTLKEYIRVMRRLVIVCDGGKRAGKYIVAALRFESISAIQILGVLWKFLFRVYLGIDS